MSFDSPWDKVNTINRYYKICLESGDNQGQQWLKAATLPNFDWFEYEKHINLKHDTLNLVTEQVL